MAAACNEPSRSRTQNTTSSARVFTDGAFCPFAPGCEIADRRLTSSADVRVTPLEDARSRISSTSKSACGDSDRGRCVSKKNLQQSFEKPSCSRFPYGLVGFCTLDLMSGV
eukprot:3709022-Pleurochrysis_carterae.AAC.2